MASISVLGCGWLGFPLAEKLIEDGYKVKGSSTTTSKLEKLREVGIDSFHLDLPDIDHKTNFFNSDYLIINTPPQAAKKGTHYHYESILSIINLIPAEQKIIYISATSVYPQVDHAIAENHKLDHKSDRAQALMLVEKLLLEKFKSRLTIIRMGGLLGYDRIPGKYFSNRSLKQYQQKVNYIHREDAIGLILTVLKKNIWGLLINGVAPQHPSKKEVFLQNARDFNFSPPIFENTEQVLTNRIIISTKIESILDYSFIYPDPLHFFYTN